MDEKVNRALQRAAVLNFGIRKAPGWACPELAEPHWKAVWEPNPPKCSYILHDPDASPEGGSGGECPELNGAGLPVAVIRCFPRIISTREISINCFGIGGVYTLPAYRDRGCANMLLEWFASHAEYEGKCPCIILISGNPAKTLYSRNHFEPLHTHLPTWIRTLVPGLEFTAGCYWHLEPSTRF